VSIYQKENSMNTDKQFLDDINKINEVVSRRELVADLKNACPMYQTIKPLFKTTLPIIEKIPIYGLQIANSIRFLMGIADFVCK
jgi:hypothetical protein